MYYFAYGSNMNPERVTQRGLAFRSVRGGHLVGLGLRFNKQSRDHAGNGHANIVFAPEERVEGVLYELIDTVQISLMDRFENAPINYSRERVVVRGPGGACPAWTYFANPAVMARGLKPTRAYLDHLLAGQAFLSETYFQWLANTECVHAPRA